MLNMCDGVGRCRLNGWCCSCSLPAADIRWLCMELLPFRVRRSVGSVTVTACMSVTASWPPDATTVIRTKRLIHKCEATQHYRSTRRQEFTLSPVRSFTRPFPVPFDGEFIKQQTCAQQREAYAKIPPISRSQCTQAANPRGGVSRLCLLSSAQHPPLALQL
jgi:hypothetical protein